ncbi:nitroreductase family protein [Anaerolentibacter hominis]|uniref:nitroreductase family protein n=1 Tax=Anaerolentibacter hominis TaxID=3079009 RepID=UPI0031B86E4B
MNEVMKAIRERSSTRGFTDEKVSREMLDVLIEAALASPSGMNRQPWQFTVVEDKKVIDDFEKLHVDYLMEHADDNRREVLKGRNFRTLYNAPLFILISTKNGEHIVDAGIAVENIVLAAQSIGLGSVIIGGCDVLFDDPKLGKQCEELFRFPDGYKFAVGVVIGHKAVEKDPHELDYSKVTRM